MWMNPYVADTLIRERLAEAQREGARRPLVRSAGSATAQRHPWAFLQHLAEAISTLWPKSGKERMVDRGDRGQRSPIHAGGSSSGTRVFRVPGNR
jgi:hypothetical protein